MDSLMKKENINAVDEVQLVKEKTIMVHILEEVDRISSKYGI